MNNYGAKDFLKERFEALRARRNELAAIIGPQTKHRDGASDPHGCISSLDELHRLPAGDPVPAAVLFRGLRRA